MPELSFEIVGAEAGARGLTPLLYFRLRLTNAPAGEKIQAVLLRTQIQVEAPRRTYRAEEKMRLADVFGTPDRWGQTLRNRLWTQVDVSVPPFSNETEVRLPVACSYDLNILASKYLYALEAGVVPLLFLFSGTVFYAQESGQLQVRQISWEKECRYAMPVERWKNLMESFYPQSSWIALRRDVFDQLCGYKSRQGCASWEEAMERLLAAGEFKEGIVA